MREFRFILGRRALIVFLALLVVTGAFFGAPAATRTLAGTADGWRDLNPLTPSPTARVGHAMAALPSGNVLLFGGATGSATLNDTWLFNTATNTWGLLTGSTSPSARAGHAMATLPGIGVLLFGGYDTSPLGDTWLFTYDGTGTGTWSKPTISSSTPTARYGHAMASTPSGVLLFGGDVGYYASNSPTNDTWLFTYDNTTKTGTWTETNTVAPHNDTNTPTARMWHAMAALLPSGNVLLFGGEGSVEESTTFPGGTWQFNTITNTWGLLTGSTSPTARAIHAMATLPGIGGVLLFGGYGSVDGSTTFLGDTWLFNTSAGSWTQLSTSPTPTARMFHAMASTPSGALLFGGGGVNITGQGGYLNNGPIFLGDTWLYGPTTPPPPTGMPGMSPWALGLLSLALLSLGGWWFLRRRRLA